MKVLNPTKIKSIDALILVLNSCEIDQTENCYLSAMRSVDIPFVKWEKYFKFSDDKPKRIRLSKTDDYELLMSCWEKGQEGPIHDIDAEEAWIHPICGNFIEERYKLSHNKLEQVSSILLKTQSYSYMQKPSINM
jgi:cysteine dioxygenase